MNAQSAKVIDLPKSPAGCGHCRLQDLCLAQGLNPSQIAALESIMRRARPLERGAYLYRQGERLRSLYAVRSGSVKTYFSTADGLEQVTGFYLPGDIIGFDGYRDGRHACAAQVLEISSVCELPYDRTEALCGQVPGLLHRMLSLIGQAVTDEQEMRLLVSQRTARERLASFLVGLSTRMSARGYSGSEFNLSMSRSDIASYLGIEPETVSRQLAQLEAQGLVSALGRRVVLENLGRLRALANAPSAPAAVAIARTQ
jgi:CRP/FNR family transcriptional regulator